MADLAVPRSWVWHARLRAGASGATMACAPVFLVTIASKTALAVTAAFGIGVLLLVLLTSIRSPSPTQVAVAGALRTGQSPAALSLALVDTEAEARLRYDRWPWLSWAWGCVWVAVGVFVVVVKGAPAGGVAYWSVFSVSMLASSWALSTSAREAVRWRAGADERWAAWAAADRASAG